MKRIRLIFILFFVCRSSLLLGSEIPSEAKSADAAIWAGFQLNQNLPGKWLASYEYQSRFTKNISFHRGHFNFLSLTWKPIDFFFACLEYRNVIAFDSNTHRLGIELNLKKKWKRVVLIKRTVFQSEHYSVNTLEQPSSFPANFWRERILLRYELQPKLKFTASTETFFTIGTSFYFQRLRTQVGLSYELTKQLTLNALWLFQEEFNTPGGDKTHAWVINTSFDLPNWWKKKKKKEKQKTESSVLPHK
jgi:hypothetical protein